jgi:serine/threonine protein kinase
MTDINQKIGEYTILEKIDRGGRNSVYKIQKDNNEILALKKIKYYHDIEDSRYDYAKNEIKILEEIQHPNIIKLFHYMDDTKKKEFYIFIEYGGVDLKSYMHDVTNYDYKNVIKQILLGVEYLHRRNFIHLDLKPQNIVILNGEIKIIDFDCTQKITDIDFSSEFITLWYRPPELLLNCKSFGYEVDMWSVGCIIFEIVNNEPLFPGDSEIDQLYRISRILGRPPRVREQYNIADWERNENYFKGEYKELILKLLDYDPIKRISAKSALDLILNENCHLTPLIPPFNKTLLT